MGNPGGDTCHNKISLVAAKATELNSLGIKSLTEPPMGSSESAKIPLLPFSVPLHEAI